MMNETPKPNIAPASEQPQLPPSDVQRPRQTRRSIRTRLLVHLLSLTLVAVLTLGWLGVNSVQSVGKSAQQTSGKALRDQAEEYMRQVTIADAQKNNLILKEVQNNASDLARYAANVFERPEVFASAAYWKAEDHMSFGTDGQYVSSETDVSSVYIPNFAVVDQELLQELELSAYLELAMIPMFQNVTNTVAIYLGTEHHITRYYPNINLGAILPPDFQVTGRPWYVSASPENNPERAARWSPVYVDATGQGLLVTAAAPIYANHDEFIGVIGIDVKLDEIDANIATTQFFGGGYSFLIDDTGHAIILPEQGYQDVLGRSSQPDEFGTDLGDVTAEFAPALAEMMAGATGFKTLSVGGRELFIAYAPLESTGWSLANVVEAEKVLQPTLALQKELASSTSALVLKRILPIGGIILVIMMITGSLMTNRLVNPVQKMAAAAQRIGEGQWDAPLPPTGDDEIGVLSQALATMTRQLRELMQSLEQRVAERTQALQEANYDLQRRAIHLEASAEVAKAIISIFDVDVLLRKAVNLIRDHFGFYHAGIFLVDSAGEWAFLREATGEAGAQMKIQGHRLAVADTSMVGWTAHHRQPRIALYATEDEVRFANPLLPYTRSEMTLPMLIGDRLLGVLNVQSEEEAAFDEDDVRTLQSMANQIAVAVENARRFSDETLLLEAASPTYQLSRSLAEVTEVGELADAIVDSVSKTGADGCTVVEFEFSSDGEPEALLYRGVWRRDRELQFRPGMRLPITDSPFPFEMISTMLTVADVEQDERLPQSARRVFVETGVKALVNIPLRVRERVIGQVVVLRTTTGPFSDAALRLYEALSDQAAVALERAQLWEDAQRRAQQEQITRQTVDRIRRAMDIDQALRTAAEELSQAIQVPHVAIELNLEALMHEL